MIAFTYAQVYHSSVTFVLSILVSKFKIYWQPHRVGRKLPMSERNKLTPLTIYSKNTHTYTPSFCVSFINKKLLSAMQLVRVLKKWAKQTLDMLYSP